MVFRVEVLVPVPRRWSAWRRLPRDGPSSHRDLRLILALSGLGTVFWGGLAWALAALL